MFVADQQDALTGVVSQRQRAQRIRAHDILGDVVTQRQIDPTAREAVHRVERARLRYLVERAEHRGIVAERRGEIAGATGTIGDVDDEHRGPHSGERVSRDAARERQRDSSEQADRNQGLQPIEVVFRRVLQQQEILDERDRADDEQRDHRPG